jgi:hypothetical protein
MFFIVENYSLAEQKFNIVNKITFVSLGYEKFAVNKCRIHNQHKRHTIKRRTKFQSRLRHVYNNPDIIKK